MPTGIIAKTGGEAKQAKLLSTNVFVREMPVPGLL